MANHSMTDQEWERFFVYVDKIVNGPGTVQDKAALLSAKAEEADASTDLSELASYISE